MTRKKKQIIVKQLAQIAKTTGIFIESKDAISEICDNIVDIAYVVGGHKMFEEILKLIK